ncbi:MAG: inositol monophosphatase family protein [Planctomycetota bacterium]
MSPAPEPFDLANALSFARALASIAELEILPRFQSCAATRKSDGTEVTEADVLAERAMRRAIAAQYPDHSVLGEEDGVSGPREAEYQWILDPIDGTSWFVLGVPIFGTLIALARRDQPVVGVIHFPALGQTVSAARGLGCWFRSGHGKPTRVHVRPPTALAQASVSASGIHGSDLRSDAGPAWCLSSIIRNCAQMRFHGDCYQHALVCRGEIDAAVDTIMQPWDSAALIPCVEEAGGVASTLSGDRTGVPDGGSFLSSSGAELHEEIVCALRPRA